MQRASQMGNILQVYNKNLIHIDNGTLQSSAHKVPSLDHTTFHVHNRLRHLKSGRGYGQNSFNCKESTAGFIFPFAKFGHMQLLRELSGLNFTHLCGQAAVSLDYNQTLLEGHVYYPSNEHISRCSSAVLGKTQVTLAQYQYPPTTILEDCRKRLATQLQKLLTHS